MAAIRLSGTLSGRAAEAVVSKAREELESHLNRSVTSETLTSGEIPPGLIEAELEKRDSKTDMVGEEVKQAATQFLTGVDTITDVLLLVLGKLGMLIHRLIFVGVVLGLGLGYAIARSEKLLDENAKTAADMAEMVKSNAELNTRLTEALAKIEQVSARTQEVGKKVDAVKEDQSGIKLIQENGRTKLVFQPRLPSRVIEDKSIPLDAEEEPAPLAASSSISRPPVSAAKAASPARQQVEIPLSDTVLQQAIVRDAPPSE
jgi:hypothetical protein